MSPIWPVTGEGSGLIATVVSFDWRFCASLLGVTLPVPPSTLLLSLVTFAFGPTIAWLPWAPGAKTSAPPSSTSASVSGRRRLIGRPPFRPLKSPLVGLVPACLVESRRSLGKLGEAQSG